MANKIENKKITEFRPDPANANKGTERGLRVLDDSIAQTGLGRSIVVDKNGVVIAGNKTQDRAVDHGLDDAIVVHTDGKQLVVVQRDDLDLLDNDPNNPARKLAYYDNRAGELGLEWDAEQILVDLNAGMDLDDLFFDWEIDQIRALDESNFDPYKEWQNMPAFEDNKEEIFLSIRVDFLCEKDMKAFAQLIGQTITQKTTSIYYPKKEQRIMQEYIDEP